MTTKLILDDGITVKEVELECPGCLGPLAIMMEGDLPAFYCVKECDDSKESNGYTAEDMDLGGHF